MKLIHYQVYHFIQTIGLALPEEKICSFAKKFALKGALRLTKIDPWVSTTILGTE